VEIKYNPAGPVADEFHKSNAFIRGLMGPVGSSKSSACCLEIFSRACEQRPYEGVRKSRWLVIRNTYPMLKSTTIKTWTEWFPEPICRMKWDAPITGTLKFPLPDKTTVDAEVIFMALDSQEDISSKLRSFEVTGVWLNEASEMDKAALDMSSQRVGRFPPAKWGVTTWSGVIMDTNPPDSDHWWYKLAEERDERELEAITTALRLHGGINANQKLVEFFKQPGGLLYEAGEYKPNPKAENVENLPGKHGYYFRQLVGKDPEWIKVFVLGQYGVVVSGNPVYKEYNDALHCQEVAPYRHLPLLLGFDYGGTPACVIGQMSPKGQLIILDELCSQGESIESFTDDVLKPFLATNYPDWFTKHWKGKGSSSAIQAWGDPAGNKGSETDAKTCFMSLAEKGIICFPAFTNEVIARHQAVKRFLNKMVDGKPALQLSPRCGMLRRGFLGKYCFERVQVTGKSIFRDKVDKRNPYSHPHDALQYLAMGVTQVENVNWREELPKPRVAMI
jgi:hypothetical protein